MADANQDANQDALPDAPRVLLDATPEVGLTPSEAAALVDVAQAAGYAVIPAPILSQLPRLPRIVMAGSFRGSPPLEQWGVGEPDAQHLVAGYVAERCVIMVNWPVLVAMAGRRGELAVAFAGALFAHELTHFVQHVQIGSDEAYREASRADPATGDRWEDRPLEHEAVFEEAVFAWLIDPERAPPRPAPHWAAAFAKGHARVVVRAALEDPAAPPPDAAARAAARASAMRAAVPPALMARIRTALAVRPQSAADRDWAATDPVRLVAGYFRGLATPGQFASPPARPVPPAPPRRRR